MPEQSNYMKFHEVLGSDCLSAQNAIKWIKTPDFTKTTRNSLNPHKISLMTSGCGSVHIAHPKSPLPWLDQACPLLHLMAFEGLEPLVCLAIVFIFFERFNRRNLEPAGILESAALLDWNDPRTWMRIAELWMRLVGFPVCIQARLQPSDPSRLWSSFRLTKTPFLCCEHKLNVCHPRLVAPILALYFAITYQVAHPLPLLHLCATYVFRCPYVLLREHSLTHYSGKSCHCRSAQLFPKGCLFWTPTSSHVAFNYGLSEGMGRWWWGEIESTETPSST